MENHADPSKPKTRDRLKALRKHAIAIGALIDELQPQDLGAWRPGDIAQICPGEPNAGALVRVTRVVGGIVRGYLLAARADRRDSPPWAKYEARNLLRVGHAPDAVEKSSYPLQEKLPPTLEQYAAAARQEWIRYDAAKKAERNKRAKARRDAKKAKSAGDGSKQSAA